MSEQFALIATSDLEALRAEVAALTRIVSRSTVIPKPKWVTISEAAEHLGVTPGTVRRYIAQGRIEARGSGKARRVRIED